MAKRVKNTALKVNESSTAGMSAISGDWVTDTASTASELQYLSYLEKRFQLGLITKEDVQALSRADSAEEKLVIKLLKRLNQFSPYSSEWAQITSIFGTKGSLANRKNTSPQVHAVRRAEARPLERHGRRRRPAAQHRPRRGHRGHRPAAGGGGQPHARRGARGVNPVV